MCAGCALLAVSAASGARQFLLARLGPGWARKVAVGLVCLAALGVSTVGVAGSGSSAHQAPPAAAAPARVPAR